MGKRSDCDPVLVTEFGKMYVREGLFYVPFYSWDSEHLVLMSPCTALGAVQRALQTLRMDNVLPMKSTAGH